MAEDTEAKLAAAGADFTESTEAPGVTDDPALDNDEMQEAVETQAAAEAADAPIDAPERTASPYDALGDDFKGLDESGAIARLAALRQQALEAQQLRQQAQWYQWQQQQAQQQELLRRQAEAAAQQQQKPKREVPPYDPEWLNQIVKDTREGSPTFGEWIAKPNAPYDLPDRIRKYQAWRDAEDSKHREHAWNYLKDNYGDDIRQFVREINQAEWQQQAAYQAQQAEQQAMLTFQAKHAKLLFHDPVNKVGETPLFYQVVERAKQYMQMGVASPAKACELAMDAPSLYGESYKSEYERMTSAEAQAAAAQQKVQGDRIAFQKRATPAAGRKPSPARQPATPEVTTSTSSLGLLQKKFAARGHKVREDVAD